VYRLDYADVVSVHADGGADVTMVTTRRPVEEASRYGVVRTDHSGQVTDYAYKPDEPASDVVTTEVFVFTPERVLDLLGELADGGGLDDLGDQLLPRLVADGRARAYPLDGYWRDLGTVPAYHQAHLELAADPPPIRLADHERPMLTANAHHGTARVDRGAQLADALLSPGARVGGRVERSVLSPGVIVEPGAEVVDSVLLHGVVVERGATVRGAVVDTGARVGAEARLGLAPGTGDDDVVLVAAGARISPDADVPRGTRVRA